MSSVGWAEAVKSNHPQITQMVADYSSLIRKLSFRYSLVYGNPVAFEVITTEAQRAQRFNVSCWLGWGCETQ